MYKILSREQLCPDVVRFVVAAPLIARKRQPGQFAIIRNDEKAERIPLTICDSDAATGTVTFIIQGIGASTKQINMRQAGESFLDVAGPLGNVTHIEKLGTVVSVGGGVGTAVAYPIAKAMKQIGNRVISIAGFRNKDFLILEKELKATSDELIVTTDDGSYGRKGLVTEPLKELLDKGGIDTVLAIGPLVMMQAVYNLTKSYNVKTIVSLNPIMIDGTGMCGGCRVTVGGKQKFVCVDGPEFDAADVDFDELKKRLAAYREMEKQALEYHVCRIRG